MSHVQVLIVGAGPTGLVLALWLTQQGIKVRLVDQAEAPGTTSRALAVQARTLELYRQLDLADAVVSRGHKVPAINLWTQGHTRARIAFRKIGEGLSPYPFLLIFPQDEHERLLIERLNALGVQVERRVEMKDFQQTADGVRARLTSAKGDFTCEADYLAGCDGARSTVRESAATGFPGGTYRQVFYVADVEAQGLAVNGELHVDLDEADFLAVFPLADQNRVRLIGTIRDERVEHLDTLKFEDVGSRAIEHLGLTVNRVNWFSTYHVHHRVAPQFRIGRVFLLGDAAHIHSPAGGQGMNTGIGDAINLAWKLKAVLTQRASDGVLDSYAIERQAFAKRLVASTDRAFTFATAQGPIAEIVRTLVVPAVASSLLKVDQIREYMFRTVSQITLNYRDMPLSAGAAGHVHGGDRLPWVHADGIDNYTPFADIGWQVHVYGTAKTDLRDWCTKNSVALHVMAWTEAAARAGLRRDAAYLMRPDTYVALAEPDGSVEKIARYFADRNLKP